MVANEIICSCGCGGIVKVSLHFLHRKIKAKFISGHNLVFVDRHKPHTVAQNLRQSILRKKMYAEGAFVPSRLGMESPMKGKHHSKTTKDKLRIANLGKHHSEFTKEKCRIKAKLLGYGLWMNGKKASKETRMKISDSHAGKMPANIMRPGRFGNVKRGWYNINGKKMFFRSKWEVNYALYLDFLVQHKNIRKWEYEAESFVFEKIKFGTRSYRPDFKIENNDGTLEYHEIKGWMDRKSLTKLKRMEKYFPDIKIRVLRGNEIGKIIRQLKGIIKFY